MIVHDEEELADSLRDAYRFDDEIIVEEFITGREFSLGVVNEQAMPAIEIVVNDGWYDYEHKFKTGTTTQFITPPDIDEEVHDEMKRVAVKTMKVLGMTNYGRVDFLVNDQGVYVIEANNLPGMTPLSLLPQEAEAAGISYEDLCESIILGKQKLYQEAEK